MVPRAESPLNISFLFPLFQDSICLQTSTLEHNEEAVARDRHSMFRNQTGSLQPFAQAR